MLRVGVGNDQASAGVGRRGVDNYDIVLLGVCIFILARGALRSRWFPKFPSLVKRPSGGGVLVLKF